MRMPHLVEAQNVYILCFSMVLFVYCETLLACLAFALNCCENETTRESRRKA